MEVRIGARSGKQGAGDRDLAGGIGKHGQETGNRKQGTRNKEWETGIELAFRCVVEWSSKIVIV